jgi:ubiquinone/menaquinone biosynthesis C-methylase UbiE
MRGISADENDPRYIFTHRFGIVNLIILIKRDLQHTSSFDGEPIQRILEVGCGDGVAGRALVDKKVTKFVVGIDKSHDMIELAKAHCDNDAEHYKYIVKDAANLSGLGQFPVIFQMYMLCEIENVDQLSKVLGSIRQVCSGIFVGLISSPFFDLKNRHKLEKYRIKYEPKQQADGNECYVTLQYQTANEFTLTDYWYTSDTYEKLFKKAGFKLFEWVPCQIDSNATEEEKEFLSDMVDSGKDIGFIASI